MTDTTHAEANARAWLATIREYASALGALEGGGAETVAIEGETFDDADAVRERIQESVLSVEVRDGWRLPGERDGGAAEYRILLTTGGPGLKITGELTTYGEPDDTPDIQYQDWGTPWRSLLLSNDDATAVRIFAGVFYYGEGGK